MSIEKKRKFQDSLFPEGIYLENNEFRTTKINGVLRVIEEKNYSQSILVGKRGFELMAFILFLDIFNIYNTFI